MTRRPVRVLWVYHSAVVSAWRRARVQALAAQGIEVTVATAKRWNEGGDVVALDPTPDERVVPVATSGRHPFLFAYDPRPLSTLLRRGAFDLIDVHEEPASVALTETLTLVRLWAGNVPVVCYSAQNLLKRYPLPVRVAERRNLRRVAAVHSCNADVERVLRAKGFDGEVVNLGLGVDVDRFSPATGSGARGIDGDAGTQGALRIGYVGRLEARKGVFTLLAALEQVHGVDLAVVGAGPDADRFRRAVTARRSADRVTVRGYVGHDDLPEVYRSLDVLVVPSISTPSWTEQFGRVVVEAMASGVPVIVSDAGALPEVVGDAGIVVPEADACALARAIGRLRDEPAIRSELRDRGLRRARTYSWARIAADQASLYRRVVGN